MQPIRIGVVGLGNMGTFHCKTLAQIKGATLAAVCDPNVERREQATTGASAVGFEDYRKMLDAKCVDAVIIATPHRQHPEMCIDAFEQGVHVLCEKPIAVSIGEARRINAAADAAPGATFAAMFQMRTYPLYRKMREMIAGGELGVISRITWLITDWFRTWAYYASGGWRATWGGEGGGVLINQCPHNLDLIQWITGLAPNRVTAVAAIGKTHPIEVEDEVSAILEYPQGAIGHFVTTTGEAPGTNRLEIAGDHGKLVAENGKLTFHRTQQGVRSVRETSSEPFAVIATETIDIALPKGEPEGHAVILQNFVNAIQRGEPLIAPGRDGAAALQLGNAIQMAGLTRRAVELPLDAQAYDQFLAEMTTRHGGRKTLTTRPAVVADMSASFAKS